MQYLEVMFEGINKKDLDSLKKAIGAKRASFKYTILVEEELVGILLPEPKFSQAHALSRQLFFLDQFEKKFFNTLEQNKQK